MITIKVQNPEIPKRLQRLGRSLARPRAALADLGGHWQRRVKRSMPDLPPLTAAAEGRPPGVHSSEYVHSIIYEVDPQGRWLRIGSSSVRARILEEGGTIRARHRRMLSIPIAVESYGKRTRDFGELSIMAVFRRAGMKKILLGRGDVPLFVLQPRVEIRPHPHMEPTREDWDYFGRAIEHQADRELGVA